jgi:hypothetical protein
MGMRGVVRVGVGMLRTGHARCEGQRRTRHEARIQCSWQRRMAHSTLLRLRARELGMLLLLRHPFHPFSSSSTVVLFAPTPWRRRDLHGSCAARSAFLHRRSVGAACRAASIAAATMTRCATAAVHGTAAACPAQRRSAERMQRRSDVGQRRRRLRQIYHSRLRRSHLWH